MPQPTEAESEGPRTRQGEPAAARDRPHVDAQKPYRTVLEQSIEEATGEFERPAAGLLLSAFSAGLDLGFGPFLMAAGLSLVSGTWSHPAAQLLTANAYAVGFIFVVIGRSTLFTERTTSAVLPVLDRRASLGQLFRLWAMVLAANVAGAAAIAALIAYLGPALGIVRLESLEQIASKLIDHSSWIMLLSAVSAGWLMGLMAWLVTASRDTFAQLAVVWMTTFLIGMLGLHHSIAGTIEILMAVFAGAGATPADYARFLLWSVIGNAIGGSCFVALLKFGHVRAGGAT